MRVERVCGRARVEVFFDPDARMSNREDAPRGFYRCNIYKLDDLFDPLERFDGVIMSVPQALAEKHGRESEVVFEYVARCAILYSTADHPELPVERDERGDLVFQPLTPKTKRKSRALRRDASP